MKFKLFGSSCNNMVYAGYSALMLNNHTDTQLTSGKGIECTSHTCTLLPKCTAAHVDLSTSTMFTRKLDKNLHLVLQPTENRKSQILKQEKV